MTATRVGICPDRVYFSFGAQDLSGFWKPDRSAPNLNAPPDLQSGIAVVDDLRNFCYACTNLVSPVEISLPVAA